MKRVYKTVTVAVVAGGCEIRLDNRPVRTPGRVTLAVPSRALAEAIAAEWDAQRETVDPQTMPLTQLAATAADRVWPQRAQIAEATAAYAATDLLCHRADQPPELAQRQQRHWQPLLDWAALRFDAPLRVTAWVMPLEQPEASLRALRRAVEAYDDLILAALQDLTASCGSLVLALAVVEGRIGPEEAFTLSQLDESYQIEQWGEDAEAARRRERLRHDIAAAARFVALLRDDAGPRG